MFNIKSVRSRIGITQKQLANKAGITQAYLSEIETGKTIPSLSVLERLALALDMEITQLFNEHSTREVSHYYK